MLQVKYANNEAHTAFFYEQFQKELLDDKKLTRLEEQYPWFIGAAFICFLFEWLL